MPRDVAQGMGFYDAAGPPRGLYRTSLPMASLTRFLPALLTGRRRPITLSLLFVPAIVALSRLIGLVREALLSKLLGLGAGLDLFVIFTTVPTYALSYVLGPFAVAFYASLNGPGVSVAGLWRRLLPWAGGIATFAAVLVFIASALYEPRLRAEGGAVDGYWWIAVGGAATVPAAILIGMAICLLHAQKKHTLAVLLSVAQPWLFVSLLLAVDLTLPSVTLLPVGVSYVLSFLVIFAAVYGIQGARLTSPASHDGADSLAAFRRNLGMTTVETAGFFGNQLLTMFFAGLAGAGGIAANGLVARIMLMPLSLMLSPLSPILQNAYLGKSAATRRRIFLKAYCGILALVAVSTFAVVIFGTDVVRFFFERGAFTAEDTAKVAALLLPYCVYVIFIAANQLCATAAFVAGEGKAYTVTMIANYVGGNLLKIPMLAHYGLEGVIWAAAISEGAAAVANSWRQFSAHRTGEPS